MPETIHSTAVPCQETVLLQQEAGMGKFTGETPTYPRYGTPIHFEVEAKVAELTGTEPSDTLIFATGMTAVKSALEVGLVNAPLNQKQKLAFATELYTGSTKVLRAEAEVRRIPAKAFYSGDKEDSVDAVSSGANVLFYEAVANYVSAPVADNRAILEASRELGQDSPMIVVDDTLSLDMTMDLYEATTPEDNYCFVRSGFKSYTNNNEKLGIAFSKNPAIVQALRNRRNEGGLPGIGSARYINELLPSKQEFKDRQRLIFANTGYIARRLYEISQNADYFTVDHPSLPNHQNYAQPHVANGGDITPVIFLNPDGSKIDPLSFAQRIGDDPGVKLHTQNSDSFAFDRTAFHSTKDFNHVRLAPGAYTDVKALGNALENALLK